MKPIKRKWAQVSLALHYLGWGLFVVAGLIFGELLERDFNISTFGVGMLGVGLMLMGPVFWRLTARCPHCGKRGGPLSWVYKKSYCSRCGHILPFDDGPLNEEETPLDRRARMGVKRGWAWLVLVLTAAGAACILAACRIMDFAVRDPADLEELWARQDVGLLLLLAGFLLLLAMAFAADFRLVCPNCRKGHILPWQRRGKVRWCWHCGAALAFGDEREAECPAKGDQS